MTLFPLLPHRPPFLLLDTLDSADTDGAHGTLVVRADNPCVNEGTWLEPVAYAEIMAQCFAAMSGLQNIGQTSRLGYLAALRDMHILGAARVGDILTARVCVTAVFGGIYVLEGQVYRDKDLLAKGQLKIFVAESA